MNDQCRRHAQLDATFSTPNIPSRETVVTVSRPRYFMSGSGQQQPADISGNSVAAPAAVSALAPAAVALHSIYGWGNIRSTRKGNGHTGSSTTEFPADIPDVVKAATGNCVPKDGHILARVNNGNQNIIHFSDGQRPCLLQRQTQQVQSALDLPLGQ